MMMVLSLVKNLKQTMMAFALILHFFFFFHKEQKDPM